MAVFTMPGENEQNWSQFFSDAPIGGYSTLQQQLISGQGKTPGTLGAITSPTPSTSNYSSSPYANYFNGAGVSGLTPEQQWEKQSGDVSLGTGLTSNLVDENLSTYNKVTAMPEKVTVQELLKLYPQASFMSPQVQQAFADNYRLGMASLLDPKNLSMRLPVQNDTGQFQIRHGDNDESKYFSIQTGEIGKLGFDPVSGFNQGTATYSQPQDSWIQSNIAPLLKAGLASGVLAGAGMGLSNMFSGVGTAAGSTTGAASTAAGAGGSLGGAAAEAALGTGMITSPTGLAGLVGAAPIGTSIPAVAGGFLNPALAGGLAGAAGTAASGGFGDLPFQSPSSISPIGESTPLNNTGTGLSPVGSTAPDLGTGMITSPEGLSGLVNSPPIGTTLGAATPGTTGGFLNPILGGATIPTTAAAAGLAPAGGFDVTNYLSDLFGKGADKFMEKPLENSLGLISAISSTSQGKDLADTLKNLMNQGLSQSDPFGSQRAQYAAKLKQTYDNPNTYLQSPEYQGISRKRLEALERADAAQGRKSQYGARAENMYEFDQENLMKERKMLAELAGAGISPGQVSSLVNGVGVGSANAQVNANGQLYALLASMFKGS